MKDLELLERKLNNMVKGVKRRGRGYCEWCKKKRPVSETMDYKLVCEHCGRIIPRLKEVEIG